MDDRQLTKLILCGGLGVGLLLGGLLLAIELPFLFLSGAEQYGPSRYGTPVGAVLSIVLGSALLRISLKSSR